MVIARARRPREISSALRKARGLMRWRRTWRALAVVAPVAVLFTAAWFALMRFTLLDIPAWPPLAFLLIVLTGVLVYARLARFSTPEAARFVDRSLELDERLTAYLELSSRRRVGSRRDESASNLVQALGDDALASLRDKRQEWPGRLRSRMGRSQAIALAVGLAALFLAMFLPTDLDAVRAQNAAIRRDVQAEIQHVRDLRADIVSRTGLPDDVRQRLLQQLDTLEKQLRQPGTDRAQALAMISDAQDNLRELSPNSTSDFTSLAGAAQAVLDAAIKDSNWDPTISEQSTLLGEGADAADHLAGFTTRFNAQQQVDVIVRFDDASQQSSAQDPPLSQKLAEVATSVREHYLDTAASAMHESAVLFRDADRRQQIAQSVESALSKLDDSKTNLVRSEQASTGKPLQVGFRRHDLPGSAQASAATATAQASASDGSQSQGQQGQQGTDTGTGLGMQGPAFGTQSKDAGQSTNGSQSQSGAGNGGQNGQNGQAGAKPGGAGAGSQGSNGGQGTQGSGNPSSAGSSGSDTLSGQVNGPVGGGGGAISRVPNPSGTGSGSSSIQPTNSGGGDEQVYVPAPPKGAGAGKAGSNDQSQAQSGGTGATGVGTGSKQSGSAPGALTQVRTPFSEVIGKYAQEATQALDRAYVPPDAKEYVKDYFAALGKLATTGTDSQK